MLVATSWGRRVARYSLVVSLAVALGTALGPGAGFTTTAAAAASHGGPATANGAGNLGLSLSLTSTDRVKVSWTSSTPTSKIRRWVVRTSTARSMVPDLKAFPASAKARSLVVPHAALVTPASGDSTFVKLGMVRKKGRTGYSPTKWVKAPVVTAPEGADRIVVGAFNVRSWNVESSSSDRLSWENRRSDVASTIESSGAGVVALQETGGSILDPDYRGLHQYNDLRDRLSSRWRLADDQRYYSARGREVGGQQGTRILYDSTLYIEIDHGAVEAPELSRMESRWTPWVQLRDISSGKTFYVISVHFKNGVDAKGKKVLYNLRLAQAQVAINLAKDKAADGSEVILAGDFNSTALILPNNGVHRAFVRAGFFDAFATRSVTGGAYPTTNNFRFPVNESPIRRDYIMSYGPVSGSYWYKNLAYRTSAHPASDHFMQVAQLAF